MSISEDVIMKHLDFHLSMSSPGDMLHRLSVVRAAHDATNALGLTDDSKTHTTMCAIAAVGNTVDELIAGAVMRLKKEAVQEGHVNLLAVLSQEMWVVEGIDDHGRMLRDQGRLEEHPDAVEVTMLYAAARDGRRWRSRRYLTGAKAGQTQDFVMMVGRVIRGESRASSAEIYIRDLVGL